jgi:L-iditol 2-dehydrogenase
MEIIGTFGANHEDFAESAKALSSGIVDVSKLIEEKSFTLDEIQEAFRAASQPGMYRVSVILDK